MNPGIPAAALGISVWARIADAKAPGIVFSPCSICSNSLQYSPWRFWVTEGGRIWHSTLRTLRISRTPSAASSKRARPSVMLRVMVQSVLRVVARSLRELGIKLYYIMGGQILPD